MENKIISFLISPPFSKSLSILKNVFIIFSILFLIGIIYYFSKSSWFRLIIWEDLTNFLFPRVAPRKRKIEKKWKEILLRLEKGIESELKLAVLEAEIILDESLEKIGHPGETLGEKLKKLTPEILPNLEEVFQAHQIRNNIVHDPTYKLSLEESKRVISIYERALKALDTL